MRFNNSTARQIIMKRYLTPTHKDYIKKGSDSIVLRSDVCSDVINIQQSWENDILVDAKFSGEGCAIFLAAAEIFVDLSLNKTKKEINQLASLYKKFVNNPNDVNEEELKKLGELWVFNNVNKHLNRVTCSLLITEAFK